MRDRHTLEWSRAFNVGPDDLPDEIRRLLRAAEAIDAAAVTLRLLVHTCPDRELDGAVLDLEPQRRRRRPARRLLHEVLRELR